MPDGKVTGEMTQSGSRWDRCLKYCAKTDVGLRRANNQDSHAVFLAGSAHQWRKRGHLFVVADGMGAHAAGERASRIATDTIPLSYSKRTDPPAESLVAAVEEAHRLIHDQGEADEAFRRMGTTVDALVLLPEGALVAHVGDSRVYRLRKQKLEQLTFDHSLVWEIRAAGDLKEKEVPSYIPKNVITRSLGPTEKVDVDLEGPFPIETGDIYLLCSDGLSGQITDVELGQILTSLEPQEAGETMINLANLRGGPDNITLIIVQVTGAMETVDDAPKKVERRRISTAAWSMLGLAFGGLAVSGLGLGIDQSSVVWLGLIAMTVFLLIFAAMVLGLFTRDENDSERFHGMLGKGPHTRTPCSPKKDFGIELKEILQQLRDAALSDQWKIEWDDIDQMEKKFDTALQEGRFDDALRNGCRTINLLMEKIRKQH
jgi:protein phosphatase